MAMLLMTFAVTRLLLEGSERLKQQTFFTMVVSLGSTLTFFASGPSLESAGGFTSFGFSLKTQRVLQIHGTVRFMTAWD